MRVSFTCLLVMLFLAAGCSKPAFYWYRADTSFEEAMTDYCECSEQASERAAEAVAEEYFERLRSPIPPSDAYVHPGGHDRPSALSTDDDEFGWGELYKQNAFNGCMRSRSYVKLKAHRVSPNLRTKSLSMGAIAGR